MKQRFSQEYSAGGVVKDQETRLLLVQVKNLKGETVWTFPKGHVEKGETAHAAAIREVEEETGWRCRIIKDFMRVQYWFRRGNILVKKTVRWFVMKPLKKVGSRDPKEIQRVRWMTPKLAQKALVYKSDKDILKRLGMIVLCLSLIAGCLPPPESELPPLPLIPVDTLRLKGKVFYVSAEGGLIAFRTGDGKKYHLHGDPVDKMLSAFVTVEVGELPITIQGFVPEGWADPHHYGDPFMVTGYNW